MAPLVHQQEAAEDGYDRLFQRVVTQNKKFYRRFPQDVQVLCCGMPADCVSAERLLAGRHSALTETPFNAGWLRTTAWGWPTDSARAASTGH